MEKQTKKNIIKILMVLTIIIGYISQSYYWPVHVEHESLMKKFIWVINN